MTAMGDDIIDRADALDRKIAASDDMAALLRYGHASRNLIHWLAVSIALDIMLSLALGWVAIGAQQTANQASSLAARSYQACLAGNDFRATELQLWNYILDLPPTAPRTPDQQAQQVQFRTYIDRQFAPRKC